MVSLSFLAASYAEHIIDLDMMLGYARAEILAAFGNAIFLLALCFSIFLEAIQRFIDVQGKQCPRLSPSAYVD
jgi:zinc transporter 1